jgi:hypothetical protein
VALLCEVLCDPFHVLSWFVVPFVGGAFLVLDWREHTHVGVALAVGVEHEVAKPIQVVARWQGVDPQLGGSVFRDFDARYAFDADAERMPVFGFFDL